MWLERPAPVRGFGRLARTYLSLTPFHKTSRVPAYPLRDRSPKPPRSLRHLLPHIDLAGDGGGDQRGAAFLEQVDGALGFGGEVFTKLSVESSLVKSVHCPPGDSALIKRN